MHQSRFEGEVICLFVVVHGSNGLIRLPILGGFKTNTGFGQTEIRGEVHNKMFTVFGNPKTYDELLQYYNTITGTGHILGFMIDLWDSKEPFDAGKFAALSFRQFTHDLTSDLGKSSNQPANDMYQFIKEVCSSPDNYASQLTSKGDMESLRQSALASPYGISVFSIADASIPK